MLSVLWLALCIMLIFLLTLDMINVFIGMLKTESIVDLPVVSQKMCNDYLNLTRIIVLCSICSNTMTSSLRWLCYSWFWWGTVVTVSIIHNGCAFYTQCSVNSTIFQSLALIWVDGGTKTGGKEWEKYIGLSVCYR